MVSKFSILILILHLSASVFAANANPFCRKAPLSQIQNSYPDLCQASFKAGKCENKKQEDISNTKKRAIESKLSSEELKSQLAQVDSRYSKCTPAEYNESLKARTIGCAAGVGTALKDIFLGAPEMLVEKMKEARACRDDLQTKLKAINETNSILGNKNRLELVSQKDLMKPEFDSIRRSRQFITKEELTRISCLELEQKIRHHKTKAWDSLSAAEKNIAQAQLNATIPPSIIESIKGMFEQMGLPSNCLAPKAYWEAVCLGSAEIASLFAGGGLGALKAMRMARLSKLTGKTTKELEQKLAELKGLGRDARIAKAEKEVRNLTGTQKAKLLQEEMGLRKPLNAKEMKAVEKAHLEGSARGEGYGTYKGNTLREKKRILMKERGFSELPADYMINRGIVGQSSNLKIEKINALSDGPTKSRLLGEMSSQKSKITNGVVQNPESQRYFQEAGKSMESQLEKSQLSKVVQSEAKPKMANIENYVIDKNLGFPPDRPDIARRYADFEQNVLPVQRQWEEAATSYLRAGKKDDALRVLKKSPVVSNLANDFGKQNYVQRFLEKAEISRTPSP